jgi:uncharacterized protein (TIGR03067 family)
VVNLLSETDNRLDELARRDQDRLQGTWVFFSGTREAHLEVVGAQFTIRFKNGDSYRGTLSLDPSCKPRAMDLLIVEGPDRHRGKRALAIYALDGDRLIWCPSRPGETDRPTFFPPNEDTQRLCIVFQRNYPQATGFNQCRG